MTFQREILQDKYIASIFHDPNSLPAMYSKSIWSRNELKKRKEFWFAELINRWKRSSVTA